MCGLLLRCPGLEAHRRNKRENIDGLKYIEKDRRRAEEHEGDKRGCQNGKGEAKKFKKELKVPLKECSKIFYT